MKHLNSKFQSVTIELDGAEFEGCEIKGCVLNYRGGELPKMSGCSVSHCSFNLLDAAHRTIEFLHAFHSADKGIVEGYLAYIVGKSPPPKKHSIQ